MSDNAANIILSIMAGMLLGMIALTFLIPAMGYHLVR